MATVTTLENPRRTPKPRQPRDEARKELAQKLAATTPLGFIRKPAYTLNEFAAIAEISSDKILPHALYRRDEEPAGTLVRLTIRGQIIDADLIRQDAIKCVYSGTWGEVHAYPSQRARRRRKNYVMWLFPLETVAEEKGKSHLVARCTCGAAKAS